MAVSKAKRQKIEAYILSVISTLDKTGRNTDAYKAQFKAMSDTSFESYMTQFLKDPEQNFYLEILPWENEPTMDDIKAAAKITNTELEQYVYFRHNGDDKAPIRSRHKCPVGWIHVKRLQQILTKKTGFSTDTSQRNALTNQLSGGAAVGRIADEETIALAAVDGAEPIIAEFLGARADNRDKRLNMYQNIQRDGYVNLADLSGDVKSQGTINYLDVVMKAAGLDTDLVHDTPLRRNTKNSTNN